MERADRDEIRAAHQDNAAIATVAIMGVVGICGELVRGGQFGARELSSISEFMVRSVEISGASEQLQAHLHEALAHHFAHLRSALD